MFRFLRFHTFVEARCLLIHKGGPFNSRSPWWVAPLQCQLRPQSFWRWRPFWSAACRAAANPRCVGHWRTWPRASGSIKTRWQQVPGFCWGGFCFFFSIKVAGRGKVQKISYSFMHAHNFCIVYKYKTRCKCIFIYTHCIFIHLHTYWQSIAYSSSVLCFSRLRGYSWLLGWLSWMLSIRSQAWQQREGAVSEGCIDSCWTAQCPEPMSWNLSKVIRVNQGSLDYYPFWMDETMPNVQVFRDFPLIIVHCMEW